MFSIVFATNNRHKLEEVSAMLGAELTTPRELGVTEDIPETADTLEGNALQKAHYVRNRLTAEKEANRRRPEVQGAPCGGSKGEAVASFEVFADDTGLEVEALGGAPGVYSARYAGPACDFKDNCELLLRNLAGAVNRRARFRTVVALLTKDGREHLFEGTVEGRITEDYNGDGGFGYDPIFVPDGHTETFAEMSLAQKNAISHRGRAIQKLKEFLDNYELRPGRDAKRITN